MVEPDTRIKYGIPVAFMVTGIFYLDKDFHDQEITLIRHAAIAAELDGHYIGSSDVCLSSKGSNRLSV